MRDPARIDVMLAKLGERPRKTACWCCGYPLMQRAGCILCLPFKEKR